MKYILAVIALILTSGLHAEVSIKAYRKNYSWQKEWSVALKEEFQKDEYKVRENGLLNIEIDDDDLDELQCPGYNDASLEQKSDFWVVFFSALTRAESAFNPKAVSGNRRGQRSYGLLQLAKQTAKNECGLDPKSGVVLHPKENLKCGVRLMQWQLQGAPMASGKKIRSDLEGQLFGKYIFQWGPLRQNDRSGRKLLVDWFKIHLDDLPFCNRE